ncbi:hypothetical protein KJ782_00880 [Patescibacteria group bacterium]|nr:hypothetical protein [Patescibacteria group bacterium]
MLPERGPSPEEMGIRSDETKKELTPAELASLDFSEEDLKKDVLGGEDQETTKVYEPPVDLTAEAETVEEPVGSKTLGPKNLNKLVGEQTTKIYEAPADLTTEIETIEELDEPIDLTDEAVLEPPKMPLSEDIVAQPLTNERADLKKAAAIARENEERERKALTIADIAKKAGASKSEAFSAGMHVMAEGRISVDKAEEERLEEARKAGLAEDPLYQKILERDEAGQADEAGAVHLATEAGFAKKTGIGLETAEGIEETGKKGFFQTWRDKFFRKKAA